MNRAYVRRRLPALVLLAVMAAPPGARAQAVSFTSDVGLMVFTVRADRAAAAQAILDRLTAALKANAGADPATPWPGLRVLRSAPTETADRLFIIQVEPVVPSQDYSIERLLTVAIPGEAASLNAQWREALDGARPFVADLKVLHTITPDELMRSRLEAGLAQSGARFGLPPASSGDSDRERLERLRAPLWAVEGVQYRAVDVTGGEWRFSWSLWLANRSLLGPASADVIVEFRDAKGGVVGSARARVVAVDTGERREVSGEARISASPASRVASATARVE